MPKLYPPESSVMMLCAWPVTASRAGSSSRSPLASVSTNRAWRTGSEHADVEDGVKPGITAAEHAELRGARKRSGLLGQENEVHAI